MTQRTRVLLLIPHLAGGGAEKVMALLARGLSPAKYDLHLALITQADPAGESLPSSVTVHPLAAPRVRAAAWPLLRLIWKLRPRVILSGMAHLNFLLLLLKPFLPPGCRLLVRQNTTVSTALAAGALPRGTRFLYRHLYPRADLVLCQTHAMAHDLIQTLHLPECCIAVVPNPVDHRAIQAATAAPAAWSGPGPHLLAVGRLAPEKGFDLLLQAMPAVLRRYPQATLLLAGSGPEDLGLRFQCRALGLEQSVRFAGRIDPPYALFPGASLFVLPSRQEGLPNALLEALCARLPVVALPASQGIVDLLAGRPRAWVAPEISSQALAATLLAALRALHAGSCASRAFADP